MTLSFEFPRSITFKSKIYLVSEPLASLSTNLYLLITKWKCSLASVIDSSSSISCFFRFSARITLSIPKLSIPASSLPSNVAFQRMRSHLSCCMTKSCPMQPSIYFPVFKVEGELSYSSICTDPLVWVCLCSKSSLSTLSIMPLISPGRTNTKITNTKNINNASNTHK